MTRGAGLLLALALLTPPLAAAPPAFPRPGATGVPVEFSLWQWPAEPAGRKEVAALKDRLRLEADKLPAQVQLCFRVRGGHDSLRCRVVSSDAFAETGWGPEAVRPARPAEHVYHAFAEHVSYPPQVGRYGLEVEATLKGTPVARAAVTFEIVSARPVPRDTTFLAGKADNRGRPVTTSRPVALGPRGDGPRLTDNDYPFEPQHAANVIAWERFPPFQLPGEFVAVYGSRRFLEEDRTGGPLDRGFTHAAHIDPRIDNLPIARRAWFHTPDLQVQIIKDWYAKDPARYAALKGYADRRSAFVPAEDAFKLGWHCYESWGAGGFGPYDAGLYGWDEEQMWPTIAVDLLRKHPELLPPELRALQERDPQGKDPATQARLQDAYTAAWGDFIGHTYRGARAAAAARGRTLTVWHYGSKAPGEPLFLHKPDEGLINPKTGRYRAEEMESLWPWFKNGDRVDYRASEYARQIDFFHKDFYYHTLFPHAASMYERGPDGRPVLDEQGRRKVRRDVIEETVYTGPVKVGHEDCAVAPVFLKSFLAKGENALYWLNGGKTYRRRGTLVADKRLVPALRPGNQETWGESARLGSRPVSPYLAEAAVIYSFLMGLDGLYYWDSRNYTGPVGLGRNGDPKPDDPLGDIEFAVKGLHRVSQFGDLLTGDVRYVRPVRAYDTFDRDHPIIRGVINGRDLVLAMTNPYLDPGETQAVEVWYDAPYEGRAKGWSDRVTLQPRKTHLFHARLPAGTDYDPARLYFRYTCADGRYRKTHTVTGDYDTAYPHAAAP